MKCPVCTDVTLAISTREGVEIDYCPDCRGVWLDRGELDKIIERADDDDDDRRDDRRDDHRDDRRDDHRDHRDDRSSSKPKKKKSSFLSEIFEMGG